jgi:hypothetical protein
MNGTGPESPDKKWSDIIKANTKMVQFAIEELREGNLLSAKSILESLSSSVQQTAHTFPEPFQK